MSARRTAARIAANTRWAYEADRRAATAPARFRSPISREYWVRKMREEFPQAPEREIQDRAANAHKAWQTQMSARAKAKRGAA